MKKTFFLVLLLSFNIYGNEGLSEKENRLEEKVIEAEKEQVITKGLFVNYVDYKFTWDGGGSQYRDGVLLSGMSTGFQFEFKNLGLVIIPELMFLKNREYGIQDGYYEEENNITTINPRLSLEKNFHLNNFLELNTGLAIYNINHELVNLYYDNQEHSLVGAELTSGLKANWNKVSFKISLSLGRAQDSGYNFGYIHSSRYNIGMSYTF